MGLLDDFVRHGLMSERVIEVSEKDDGEAELPKINPDVPQATTSVSDGDDMDVPLKADDTAALEALKMVHMNLCSAQQQIDAVMALIGGDELKEKVAEQAAALSGLCDALSGLSGGEKKDDATADSGPGKSFAGSGGGDSSSKSGWKQLGGEPKPAGDAVAQATEPAAPVQPAA